MLRGMEHEPVIFYGRLKEKFRREAFGKADNYETFVLSSVF